MKTIRLFSLGAIVIGERIGGEAYAGDEIEALSQFAHGVGSSLDALALHRDDSIATLREAMAQAIAALGNETAAPQAAPTPLIDWMSALDWHASLCSTHASAYGRSLTPKVNIRGGA